MNQSLRLTLDRLLVMIEEQARASSGRAPYRTPDCGLCSDSGMEEHWYGWFTTDRGLKIEASQDRPVYTRCECNPRDLGAKPRTRRFGA